jgi:hypothetical protein
MSHTIDTPSQSTQYTQLEEQVLAARRERKNSANQEKQRQLGDLLGVCSRFFSTAVLV